LLAIIGDLDPNGVGACLDVNHANLRENPADTVRWLGHRLLTLHISDNDGVDERHWMPGRGVINWLEFLGALEDSAYSGTLVYETTPVNGPGVNALNAVRENFAGLLEKLHKN
jgi:sugar phosphate isomerase/epimerase